MMKTEIGISHVKEKDTAFSLYPLCPLW